MYLRALQDLNITNTTNDIDDPSSLTFGDDEGMDDFEFSFISSIVATVFIILCLREFYVRRYGVDFCPLVQLCSRPSTGSQTQEDRDRAYAEEVQRQLDLENHEAELEAKRKDRRDWYEAFVVPYTMTVEESDFFYAQETDENGNTILEGKLQPTSRKYSSSSLSDLEAMEEESRDKSNDAELSNMEDDDEVDDSRLHLRLPIRDEEGHFRTVEGTCSICFSEYELGERVVWSELRCKHAFHYDCIMPWLVKGKKRCPICRDWFVPGARIEDQKKALAERLARESTMSLSTDGSDDGNEQDRDCENPMDAELQGSSDDSEGVSSTCDCCQDGDCSTSSDNQECPRNSARCASDMENNKHSLEKQLSSSSEDEATGSFGNYAEIPETNNDTISDSGRISPPSDDESSESIPTDLEYPVRTTASLATSESGPLPTTQDGERQANLENSEEEAVPDREEEDQKVEPVPFGRSTSQISETREMSA